MVTLNQIPSVVDLLEKYNTPYFQKDNNVFVEWKNDIIIVNLENSTWKSSNTMLGGELDLLSVLLSDPGFL
jgi:uncharacterized membrane protein